MLLGTIRSPGELGWVPREAFAGDFVNDAGAAFPAWPCAKALAPASSAYLA